VDFLLKKAPALLEEGFEIYGEENLKSVRINRHKPSISLNVSSGIDWFDLQAAIKFGETEADWKDVRRALRKKERYIKLADGSIGEIPEDWVKRFRHLFGMSEETEDGLRMSSQQVVLLDQLLEDMDEFRVDEEFQRRRERLRNFSGIKDVPLPAGFRGELRPYQKAGYNWLHFLHEYEFGGCLADDMGLGKTVQVLTFLLSLRESGHAQSPDLIVVPRSLLVNWQREAERFTPSLKVTLHFGQTRTKEQPDFSPYDLVITTYGTMLRDSMMLREQHFHYIVLDESQAIKNPLAKTSRAARRLNSDHRLVMTGTPVENTTFELWSQFAFLNPGLLGSLEYFKSEFGNPIEKEQDEQASRLLRGMVYPFILRRTKEQVAPELPPRTERVIYCDMTPAQQKFYLRTRDFYRAQLLGILDEQGMDKARMKILEGLLRLRQICNHPKLVSEKYRGDSSKMEVLLETLETLHSEGHRALVFSQ
ncbi:MAG: serine/threonine protein kinase, partial [Anaerolineae bacterium]